MRNLVPSESADPASATTDATIAPLRQTLNSAGRPLDPATLDYFEPRFGHDFSNVRVHAGSAGARSARQLNAKAYTLRDDIVFGPGRYEPGTQEGRRLIAHELAHVVQNRRGALTEVRRQPSDNLPFQPASHHAQKSALRRIEALGRRPADERQHCLRLPRRRDPVEEASKRGRPSRRRLGRQGERAEAGEQLAASRTQVHPNRLARPDAAQKAAFGRRLHRKLRIAPAAIGGHTSFRLRKRLKAFALFQLSSNRGASKL